MIDLAVSDKKYVRESIYLDNRHYVTIMLE